MNFRVTLSSLLFITLGAVADDLSPIRSDILFDGLDRIRISWATEPGEVYFLQSTTHLAEPWQDLQTDPPVLVATTNLLAYELVVTNQAQFVRVGWFDSQGPRLIPVYPRFGGIAVPRDSALETRLWDPNGVDSSSIQFSVADRTPIGLGDPRLAYTNQVLTYRPLPGETLGDYGQELNATVVVSDQVGNRSTNLWPFQLELQTILSTDIMVVGGPGGGSPGLANAGGLRLLSRNGLLLMYRYEGASSRLRQGMHLVDSTPGQGYALTVVVYSEDPSTQTVSVWTQPAALADLIEEGSVSTRSAIPNRPGGVQPHIWWETGMDLDFQHTVPLRTTLFEWSQGGGSVRAELTDASRLELRAKTGFAANFRNFTLKEFEAYAGGSATLALELYAEGNYKKDFEGTLSLITPIYGHFVIPIAGVPVEVTTKFEVDLPYELSFQAQGNCRNGITVSKEIYMGRKWDGEWHDTSRYPPLDFQWSPVEWEVSGTIYAKADVKPKMTALIYGLVGPYADLDPYLELGGWAQLNPCQYQWALYGGLDAHLGCDLTVFDRLLPDLSFEERYELIAKTRITGDENLIKAPQIVMSPRDRIVTLGAAVGFSVTVEATAPLTYRWQRNGIDLSDDDRISGSRSPVLRVASVQQSDAGAYRVTVENSVGSATSREATLTVTGGSETRLSLKLPLPGGKRWMLTTQVGDRGCTGDPDNPEPSHTGLNYFSLDFSPRTIENEGEPELDVPVYAAADAVVAFAGSDPAIPWNGYFVVLDHDLDGNIETGYTTRYLHLKDVPMVEVGQILQQGMQIGTMGGTGGYEVHLHLGIRYCNDGGATEAARRELRKVRMEGLLLEEYTAECLPGTTNSTTYFPSSNTQATVVPGMVLIPAGTFQMGDSFGEGWEDQRPVHTVTVSAFYMDKYEVTKALWDEVYAWAIGHGYAIDNRGGWWDGTDYSKGATHPVHMVHWYDVVKWCNARSEKEGRVPAYYTGVSQTTVYRNGDLDLENDWVKWDAGYRLPTEAEWEYAGRGGLSGKRFPWGDTISHTLANYNSLSSCSYDVSPSEGYHPTYDVGAHPYTSPVGSFAPNAYGLYDMAGNLWEWCWDWYGDYGSAPQANPRGPSTPPSGLSDRVLRGGGWFVDALGCRVSGRGSVPPYGDGLSGFRSVLPPGQ